jgi:hypothetical protein
MGTWAFVGTDPRTHNFYLPVCSLLVHAPVHFVLPIFFKKYWTRKSAPRTFPKFL